MDTDVDGAAAGAAGGIGAGAAPGLAETASATATVVRWLTSSCKSVFSVALHKKWSFPLRISSVTKFDQIRRKLALLALKRPSNYIAVGGCIADGWSTLFYITVNPCLIDYVKLG